MKKVLLSTLSILFCLNVWALQKDQYYVVTHNAKDTLWGTLQVPSNVQQPNLVIIIAGSGPTDRDGNSSQGLQTNAYKMLADSLEAAGIASLRYDKRGVGKSIPHAVQHEDQLRFDTYVNDVLLWVKQLEKEQGFGKLFLLGHSEGALLATLAAQQCKLAGVISVSGAGSPIGQILRQQIAKNAPAYQLQADTIINTLEKGQTLQVTTEALAPIFRASIQPYLISWMRYDPAKELAQLKLPLLILQGTADLQVPVSEAQKLRQACPTAKYYEIEAMNHVLKTVGNDQNANLAAYANPKLPIDSDLCHAIIAFCQ